MPLQQKQNLLTIVMIFAHGAHKLAETFELSCDASYQNQALLRMSEIAFRKKTTDASATMSMWCDVLDILYSKP